MTYDSIRREKLENKMMLAQASQDYLKYSLICDDLGVDPEDKPLYEMGLAERKHLSRLGTKPEGLSKKIRYESFYNKGISLDQNFSRDVSEKRVWLDSFFRNPKRKKSLETMEDISIGAQFHSILRFIKVELEKR